MYARFYRAKRRLIGQLVDSHKIAGQVRAEHIAPLGSVLLPEPFSLSERTKFWEALKGRLWVVVDRIGDRFTDEVRAKVLAGLDRRIPKPGEAEEISAAVAAVRVAAEKRGPSTGSGRAGRRRAASDTPFRRGVDA